MTETNLPQSAIPPVAESAPHASLFLREGPSKGATLSCRRIVTLIGSREGCKIVLNHRKVAPVHLVLVNDGMTVKAVDTLTSSGTKLNGLNLQLEKLADGDLLSIGEWEFQVRLQTPTVRGNADLHPLDLDPTPSIVALEHMETGRLLQPNRDVCLIGRRNGCDIVLPDPRVSRAHALIVTYYGRPAIVDLLTANQTFVNDEPIRFRNLKDNDVLTIGETKFRVRLVVSKVGEKPSTNGKAKKTETPIRLTTDPVSSDLINIEKVEGSQRWHVAESHEKLEKASRRG